MKYFISVRLTISIQRDRTVIIPVFCTKSTFNYTISDYMIITANLQFTTSSTYVVTFDCTVFPATSVKFFESVHFASSITRIAVFVAVWVFKSFVPSYHETFDKGLLSIIRIRTTLSVSLTTVWALFSISGPSV